MHNNLHSAAVTEFLVLCIVAGVW